MAEAYNIKLAGRTPRCHTSKTTRGTEAIHFTVVSKLGERLTVVVTSSNGIEDNLCYKRSESVPAVDALLCYFLNTKGLQFYFVQRTDASQGKLNSSRPSTVLFV